MGKKKGKDDKFKANPFDYMGGGRIRELGDRYGVDHRDYNINYGRTSGGGRDYKGGREEYEDAIAKAAMSDYVTRRTMEAQAMAGNKDAKKFAKKGFKNIGKVYEGNELMRDLHKEYGNGGSFSSASDFAGLTYKSVKEDRKVHNEDIDARIAANTPELPEEDPDKGFTDPQQLEQSKAVTDGKERASRFEAGMSAYGGDDEQDSAAVTPASTEPGKADSMLDAFKQKLKEDRNFKHSF